MITYCLFVLSVVVGLFLWVRYGWTDEPTAGEDYEAHEKLEPPPCQLTACVTRAMCNEVGRCLIVNHKASKN